MWVFLSATSHGAGIQRGGYISGLHTMQVVLTTLDLVNIMQAVRLCMTAIR